MVINGMVMVCDGMISRIMILHHLFFSMITILCLSVVQEVGCNILLGHTWNQSSHNLEMFRDHPEIMSWGHANKNSAGQATSWLRTIYWGQFWTDYTMARELHMPPGVLGRESPMSDKLQALFSNPFFLVKEDDSRFQWKQNMFDDNGWQWCVMRLLISIDYWLYMVIYMVYCFCVFVGAKLGNIFL